MGFLGCSGISWTTCKQSAPCSRQITTSTPHRSITLFLTPNKQCQSTKGSSSGKQPPNQFAYVHLCLSSVTYHKKVSTLGVQLWNNHLPVGVDWVHRINLQKSKVKLNGYSSSQSNLTYGNSHAIWDHTVLPAIW